jgi:hypothetical protein
VRACQRRRATWRKREEHNEREEENERRWIRTNKKVKKKERKGKVKEIAYGLTTSWKTGSFVRCDWL